MDYRAILEANKKKREMEKASSPSFDYREVLFGPGEADRREVNKIEDERYYKTLQSDWQTKVNNDIAEQDRLREAMKSKSASKTDIEKYKTSQQDTINRMNNNLDINGLPVAPVKLDAEKKVKKDNKIPFVSDLIGGIPEVANNLLSLHSKSYKMSNHPTGDYAYLYDHEAVQKYEKAKKTMSSKELKAYRKQLDTEVSLKNEEAYKKEQEGYVKNREYLRDKFSTISEDDGALSSIAKGVLRDLPGMGLYAIPGVGVALGTADTYGKMYGVAQEQNLDTENSGVLGLSDAELYASKEALMNAVVMPQIFKGTGSLAKDIGNSTAHAFGLGVASQSTDKLFVDKEGNRIGPKNLGEFATNVATQTGIGTILGGGSHILRRVVGKTPSQDPTTPTEANNPQTPIETPTELNNFINNEPIKLQPKTGKLYRTLPKAPGTAKEPVKLQGTNRGKYYSKNPNEPINDIEPIVEPKPIKPRVEEVKNKGIDGVLTNIPVEQMTKSQLQQVLKHLINRKDAMRINKDSALSPVQVENEMKALDVSIKNTKELIRNKVETPKVEASKGYHIEERVPYEGANTSYDAKLNGEQLMSFNTRAEAELYIKAHQDVIKENPNVASIHENVDQKGMYDILAKNKMEKYKDAEAKAEPPKVEIVNRFEDLEKGKYIDTPLGPKKILNFGAKMIVVENEGKTKSFNVEDIFKTEPKVEPKAKDNLPEAPKKEPKHPEVEKLEKEFKAYSERKRNSPGYKDNYENIEKAIKGEAMRVSARKREIIQGDSLEEVPGGLTKKELEAKKKKLETNYVGKVVGTPEGNGKVVGNTYGKVKVEVNGEVKTFEKSDITEPKRDIIVKKEVDDVVKKAYESQVERSERLHPGYGKDVKLFKNTENGELMIEAKKPNPMSGNAKRDEYLTAWIDEKGLNKHYRNSKESLANDPKYTEVDMKAEGPKVETKGVRVTDNFNKDGYDVKDGDLHLKTFKTEAEAQQYSEIYQKLKEENPGVVKEVFTTDEESKKFNDLKNKVEREYFKKELEKEGTVRGKVRLEIPSKDGSVNVDMDGKVGARYITKLSNKAEAEKFAKEIEGMSYDEAKAYAKTYVETTNVDYTRVHKARLNYTTENAKEVEKLIEDINQAIFFKESDVDDFINGNVDDFIKAKKERLNEITTKKTDEEFKEFVKQEKEKVEPKAEEKPLAVIEDTPDRKVINLRSKITNDLIPYDEHVNAHRGTSFDPEKRGSQDQKSLKLTLETELDRLIPFAKNDAQKELLVTEFERYQKRIVEAFREYQHARSKVMSTMITGRGNFPVAKMEKANKTVENRWNDYSDVVDKGRSAIIKKLKAMKTNGEIMSEETTRLIEEVTSTASTVKGIKEGKLHYDKALICRNLQEKLIRSANNGNVKAVEEALTEVDRLQKEHNITIFSKTNKIWGVVDQAKARAEEKANAKPQEVIKEYQGASIVRNNEIDRIQLFFDQRFEKGSPLYEDLKSWNYSPTNRCYQRKITVDAERSAERIMKKHFKEIVPDEVKPEAPKYKDALERLEKAKEKGLQSGLYERNPELLTQIDNKIQALKDGKAEIIDATPKLEDLIREVGEGMGKTQQLNPLKPELGIVGDIKKQKAEAPKVDEVKSDDVPKMEQKAEKSNFEPYKNSKIDELKAKGVDTSEIEKAIDVMNKITQRRVDNNDFSTIEKNKRIIEKTVNEWIEKNKPKDLPQLPKVEEPKRKEPKEEGKINEELNNEAHDRWSNIISKSAEYYKNQEAKTEAPKVIKNNGDYDVTRLQLEKIKELKAKGIEVKRYSPNRYMYVEDGQYYLIIKDGYSQKSMKPMSVIKNTVVENVDNLRINEENRTVLTEAQNKAIETLKADITNKYGEETAKGLKIRENKTTDHIVYEYAHSNNRPGGHEKTVITGGFIDIDGTLSGEHKTNGTHMWGVEHYRKLDGGEFKVEDVTTEGPKVGDEITFRNNTNHLGETGTIEKINDDGTLDVKLELPIGDSISKVRKNMEGNYEEVKAPIEEPEVKAEAKPEVKEEPKAEEPKVDEKGPFKTLYGEKYERDLIEHLKSSRKEFPYNLEREIRKVERDIHRVSRDLEGEKDNFQINHKKDLIKKYKNDRKQIVEEYLLSFKDFDHIPVVTREAKGRPILASQIIQKDQKIVIMKGKTGDEYITNSYFAINRKYASDSFMKIVDEGTLKSDMNSNMVDDMFAKESKYKATLVSFYESTDKKQYAKLSDGLHETVVNGKYFKYFDNLGARYEFSDKVNAVTVIGSNGERIGVILPIRLVQNDNFKWDQEYRLPTKFDTKIPTPSKPKVVDPDKPKPVTVSQIIGKNDRKLNFLIDGRQYYGSGNIMIDRDFAPKSMYKFFIDGNPKEMNSFSKYKDMEYHKIEGVEYKDTVKTPKEFVVLSNGDIKQRYESKLYHYINQLGYELRLNADPEGLGAIFNKKGEWIGAVTPLKLVSPKDDKHNLSSARRPGSILLSKPRNSREPVKFEPGKPNKSVLNGIAKSEIGASRFKTKTVPEAPNTSGKLMEKLGEEPLHYNIKKDQDISDFTDKVLKDMSLNEATRVLLTTTNPGKEEAVLGMKVVAKLQAKGTPEAIDQAVDIVRHISKQATNNGQYIQALSMFKKLTPEGMLRYAQKEIDDVVKAFAKRQPGKMKAIEEEAKQVEEIMTKTNEDVVDTVSKEVEEKFKDILARPTEATPTEATPTEATPTEATPTEVKPTEATPTEVKPTEVKPTETKPGKEKKPKEVKEADPVEDMAEALKKRVEKHIDAEDVVQKIDFEKDLVKTLHNIAKEVLPEREFIPVQPIERVKLMLKNKETALDVWDRAKKIFEDEYGKGSDEYNTLENWFNQKAEPIFFRKDLNKAISETMKARPEPFKIKDLVRKSYKFDSDMRKTILEDLKNQTQATEEEAKIIAKYVHQRINELMKSERERQLDNLFKVKEKPKKKMFVDKVFEMANLGAFEHPRYKDLVYEKYKLPVLNRSDVKEITKLMNKAVKLKEGRKKDVLYAQVETIIKDKMPSTWSDKARAMQLINLLLNSKTMGRNFLGNVTMIGLENIKDIPGSLVDKGMSIFTGKTTTILPSIEGVKTQAKGMYQGYKNVREDRALNINTSKTTGQYEVAKGKAFKIIKNPKTVLDHMNNVLAKSEDLVSYGLRLGDEPFYKGAYDERIRQLLKINKTKVVTPEIKAEAHEYALDRTFQNASQISNMFKGIQKILNFGMKFGIGNIITPYAKTPGNLIDKAIDYSPGGLIKGIVNTIIGVTDATKFDQKKIVDQIARSLTGTGIIALGWALAKNGLLNGKGSDNKQVSELEKQMGKLPYSFNINGTYKTIDWMQPTATPLMMGADIYEQSQNKKTLDNTLIEAVITGGSTLFNQGMLSGISRVFGGYSSNSGENFMTGLSNSLLNIPNQFVPYNSALKQATQLIDNVVRETSDSSKLKTQFKGIEAKLPFASKSMLPSLDTLGRTKKQHYGSKGLDYIYDVLINPGYSSKYKPTTAEKLALEMYYKTNDTKVLPKEAKDTIKYEVDYLGKNTYKYDTIRLTDKQKNELQKIMGEKVQVQFSKLGSEYNSLKTDREKANYLSNLLTKIKEQSEDVILSSMGKKRFTR